MTIWLSKSGNREGPMSIEAARARLAQESFAPDDLAWLVGTPTWVSIRDCAALHTPTDEAGESLPAQALATFATRAVSEPHSVDIPGWQTHATQPRAWTRFAARTLDEALLPALIWAAATDRFEGLSGNLLVVLGFARIVAFVPLEALFIHTFGTTLGKALFGIRVVQPDGRYLSLGRSFKRAALVMVTGDGLNVPVLSLLTKIWTYLALCESAGAHWDRKVEAVVYTKQRAAGQRIMGLLVLGGLVYCNTKAPIVALLRHQQSGHKPALHVAPLRVPRAK